MKILKNVALFGIITLIISSCWGESFEDVILQFNKEMAGNITSDFDFFEKWKINSNIKVNASNDTTNAGLNFEVAIISDTEKQAYSTDIKLDFDVKQSIFNFDWTADINILDSWTSMYAQIEALDTNLPVPAVSMYVEKFGSIIWKWMEFEHSELWDAYTFNTDQREQIFAAVVKTNFFKKIKDNWIKWWMYDYDVELNKSELARLLWTIYNIETWNDMTQEEIRELNESLKDMNLTWNIKISKEYKWYFDLDLTFESINDRLLIKITNNKLGLMARIWDDLSSFKIDLKKELDKKVWTLSFDNWAKELFSWNVLYYNDNSNVKILEFTTKIDNPLLWWETDLSIVSDFSNTKLKETSFDYPSDTIWTEELITLFLWGGMAPLWLPE